MAWLPLGWQAVAFSEIQPFPCAVLAHHYPSVPNLGDMTKFEEWPDLGTIDLLCGGTPCQSFSVAGLRAGLADPRGDLMLTFGAIAAKHRPRWLVWENVPGVLSSNGGRDFGAFLGLLGELGYGFAYRVLDAQYAGLAQRRKRVFVVGCLGDWRRAAAVLFERHSLSGHPAPRRQARKDFAGSTSDGLARCLTAGEAKRQDFKSCTLVAHALTGEGVFDTTQITSAANYSNPKAGDPCHPLAAGAHPPLIAFSAKDYGADASYDLSPTLRAEGHADSHANAGVMPAIAFQERGREGGRSLDVGGDLAFAPTAPNGGDRAQERNISVGMQVRRLTPRECERLQGFPDDYTLTPYRGKPAADGPRYKALGNSWAVPVARWVGERIALVDAIAKT